jgi:paraquat-inducible protein A
MQKEKQLTGKTAGMILCQDCHKLLRYPETQDRDLVCPRCGAAVHQRKPNSLTRTWALVIAAFIFLIPANLFPIMTFTISGSGEPSTIIDGVLMMVHHGMIPIALIVFIASICVPFLKLAGLTMLLLSVQFKWKTSHRQRTTMYGIIETIGRWSMLDVFSIAILGALVQLGILANVKAGPAGTFFCVSVVITIFAAMSFDTRLIWDAKEDSNADA